MLNLKDFKDFLKSDSALNFATESLESFVLPEVLKDIPYLLDIFPFEPSYINYKGNYNHTSYKTPGGFNYDAFVKAEPMQITIVNACFKPILGLTNDYEVPRASSESPFNNMLQSSYGKNVGSLDVMLLKFMGWQQTRAPLLLKTTKFVGPCLLVNWEVKEAASESYFNVTLKQTSLRKLKQYSFSGESGNSTTVTTAQSGDSITPKGR